MTDYETLLTRIFAQYRITAPAIWQIMLNDSMTALFNQRAAYLVASIVVLVFAWLLLSQSLAVYQALRYEPAVRSENRASPQQPLEEYSVEPILERNFFGRFVVNQEMLQQTALPTTNLQVVLRGVFTSTNPRQASAIIERPDGQVRSFRVNSVVFGNTRLHAVFNDRIVLSTNGELETLYFPEPQTDNTPAPALAQSVQQIPESVRELVENNMSAEEIRQASEELSNSTLTPEQRAELIRKRLMILRDRARENNP